MSKQSEAVKKWRKNTKRKLVAAFGGRCAGCGYSNCVEALEFHHINPDEKETHWGRINGSIISWKRIVTEIQKCVMLCSNCHKEVHAGHREVPADSQRFDETLIPDQLLYSVDVYDNCPVCDSLKIKSRTTCSVECAQTRKARIVDWTKLQLRLVLNQSALPFCPLTSKR